MHHGLLVHEGEGLEALAEDAPPPLLAHVHALLLRPLLQCAEVATVVRLPNRVVELLILEYLESVSNHVAGQSLHRLELILELGEASHVHLALLVALHAPLLAEDIRCQHRDTLASAAQLLGDTIASLVQGLARDINLAHTAMFLVIHPEVVLHELVGLIEVQPAVAVEVETDKLSLEVAQSLQRHADGLREQRPEVLEPADVYVRSTASHALEASHHLCLEALAVGQQLAYAGSGCLAQPPGAGHPNLGVRVPARACFPHDDPGSSRAVAAPSCQLEAWASCASRTHSLHALVQPATVGAPLQCGGRHRSQPWRCVLPGRLLVARAAYEQTGDPRL
mmetsp:Transcript_124443/g.346427  ORF Transcript_124443/g.346427 Transcript_124443/m.346427 type:complete len:337 (+) Transcript_124443:766-1776(+)